MPSIKFKFKVALRVSYDLVDDDLVIRRVTLNGVDLTDQLDETALDDLIARVRFARQESMYYEEDMPGV